MLVLDLGGVAVCFVVAWEEAGTALAVVGGEDIGSNQAGTAVVLKVKGRLVEN